MIQTELIGIDLYTDVSNLKNWDKNEKARSITTQNFERLVATLQLEGVKQAFKIDNTGVVYDGNNRLKALIHLLNDGIKTSANGHNLTQVPIEIVDPKTEAEKWDIAFTANEQFAEWEEEGLANFMPEFENELNMDLINIDFSTPENIPDQLTDEEVKKGTSDKKEIECPECGAKFTP